MTKSTHAIEELPDPPKRPGVKPLFGETMTPAERQRRYRELNRERLKRDRDMSNEAIGRLCQFVAHVDIKRQNFGRSAPDPSYDGETTTYEFVDETHKMLDFYFGKDVIEWVRESEDYKEHYTLLEEAENARDISPVEG